MRMFISPERKLQRIWMPKATGTLYPMTQIPPGKNKLDVFQWFDYVRPLDKNDVFNWRGKAKGTEIKTIERHAAPLQYLSGNGPSGGAAPAATKSSGTSGKTTVSNKMTTAKNSASVKSSTARKKGKK